MAEIIVAEAHRTRAGNLRAIDTTNERIIQALAVVRGMENIALGAVEEGSGEPGIDNETLAQMLWAARTLLEQACEAVSSVNLAASAAAA